MAVLFDPTKIEKKKTKRGESCAEKMAIGALKYIAIKNAFQLEMPLYENTIFRDNFTDFYVLKRGSFNTPIMQEVFYRIFQAVRELYASFCAKYSCVKYKKEDIFHIIATILSNISGDNEKSFSSKILHTLDNDSPIIDSNLTKGLHLPKESIPAYMALIEKYFDASTVEVGGAPYSPSSRKGGLVEIAKEDKWDTEFNGLCKAQYLSILGDKKATQRKRIKEILEDICQDSGVAGSTIKARFAPDNWEEAVGQMKELGVDIEKQIADISLVKKIDFYLWAWFA